MRAAPSKETSWATPTHVLVLGLTPLFSPIWMGNPLGIPHGCLGCHCPPPFPPMQKG